MNVWKPIALCSVAGLVASIYVQTAHAGGACAGQVHMGNALTALNTAKAELAQAEHNKGGWRDAASSAVDPALKSTNMGCAAAK